MRLTGSGVLPQTTYQGQDYFLLGKEGPFFNRQWSDLGGRLDAGEWAIWGAAREAYEESRGVLGSTWGIAWRLFCSTTITRRGYRAYLPYWKITTLDEIPTRFHQSTLKGHAFEEMSQLDWVKTEELFQAIMKNRPGSGTSQQTYSGKRLRPRLVGIIRCCNGYENYAANQVINLQTQFKNMTTRSETVTVVFLKSGRAFAVNSSGDSPNSLILSNWTWINNINRPSWWYKFKDSVLCILLQRPHDATQEERAAIFYALQQESFLLEAPSPKGEGFLFHRSLLEGSSTGFWNRPSDGS